MRENGVKILAISLESGAPETQKSVRAATQTLQSARLGHGQGRFRKCPGDAAAEHTVQGNEQLLHEFMAPVIA